MDLNLFLIFVKRLTVRKILNYFLVVLGYYFSVLTKKIKRFGFPISISVEPTTSCNLACPECPVGRNEMKRAKGNIEVDFFKSIVNQSGKYLLNLFLYFQGEPFLNRNFFELIKFSVDKNIYTVSSTNGHFLTDKNIELLVNSGLDKLIISIDGTTQDVYEKYRVNGDLSRVIIGTKQLIDYKNKYKSKTPFVEIQFLVLKTNEHQIEEIKELAKAMKVDKLSFKSAQICDYEDDNNFIPNNKKFRRYKMENDKWRLKKKNKNKCWRLWNSVVITWNGEVLPCCFDKNANYSYGNIKDEKIKSLIKNENFENFAKKVQTNRSSIPICNNCTE